MARRLHDLHFEIVTVYDTDRRRADELAKKLGRHSLLDSGTPG